ncbi:hypothetical protein Leryth_016760 [Lithospermum erythrorhizon]|nr:hypothetical protein Leryth_016760 [Lithospermum erythrorhizon]
MDTLSSSVSAFPLPSLHATSRDSFSYLKVKPTSNQLSDTCSNPHYYLSTSGKRNSTSILKQPISPLNHRRFSASIDRKQETVFHNKAASGYAAALVDMARCNNILEPIQKDVRRFSRLLNQKQVRAILVSTDVEEKEKGEILKEVAVKGKFHKHLVVLLKLVIEKNRVAILDEVFQEFQRIYDELTNTQSVLVSSRRKMEREEMFSVAKSVQKLGGATMVKVRQLVDEKLTLPSFAV